MKRLTILVISALLCLAANAQISIQNLRICDSRQTIMGMDPSTSELRISWTLLSSKTSTMQSAYEVSITAEDGSVLYQSGKVESSRQFCVAQNLKLEGNTKESVKVKVWDNYGRVSKVATCSFYTAPQSWQAQWIGVQKSTRPISLKTSYKLDNQNGNKKVRLTRAVAHCSAHGIYQVCINGKKISEDLLTPGWTSYKKRIQYQSYDVTSLLKAGDNSITATVAPGWYGSGMNWGKASKRFRYGKDLALMMQIELLFSDGSHKSICTTPQGWEWSYSEVTEATIYDGQTTDMTVSYSWSPVTWSEPVKPDMLTAPVAEAVRRRAPLKAVSSFVTPRGETVIDFGQNIVGWEKFRIKGHKGDTIIVKHAEVLDKDGNFYTTNLREAKATSRYVLSGEMDSFEPIFTFYGFRYICIEGLQGEPVLADFEAVPICSGFQDVGEFSCNNPIINQLQSNISWGFHDNFVDIPTDCPQRDERLGWTGDAQVFFRTATFLGNVNNFFRKWLADLAADQREDGSIPRVIPDTFPKSKSRLGATGWADCATLIPWQHYMAYGDESILAAQYESMKRWLGYCIDQSKDNSWLLNQQLDRHFGDWLFYSKANDPDGQSAVTSKALIAQAFYAESARIVANSAKVLGYQQDAQYYGDVADKVRKAFVDEYVTSSGMLVSDTQTAYVLALHFDLLPQELRPIAARRLVENIHRYKDHITTGFLGTPYICEVLTDNGYSDVAYTLLLQDTCPSWIYPVTRGATTIWERWDSIQPDGSIIKGMNSFNHYSFGAIGDWLYRSALGIREAEPGYTEALICPHAGGGFTSMSGSTITPYGRIAVAWEASQDARITTLTVDIPVSVRAKIEVGDFSTEVGSGHWTFNF